MHELKFTAIWFDDFNSEILIEASNNDFSGKVKIFAPYDKCFEMIKELDGFPKKVSDEVTFSSDDYFRNPTLGLKFYCRDSFGNTSVLVSMHRQEEAQSPKDETNSATIVVHCDPEGIKDFCIQLGDMLTDKRKTASLGMI